MQPISEIAVRDIAGTAPAIRDMAVSDRPRERLREQGANALSNAELIAILLRTGLQGENALAVAQRLLSNFNGLNGLSRAGYAMLAKEKGLSHAKSCQLMAGIELGKRVAAVRNDDEPMVTRPVDIANRLMPEMGSLEREQMRVVLLDTKHRIQRITKLYMGSVDAALVRPAEVFAEAVQWTAPAIALVHNHPSGDPYPSDQDIAMTERLIEAGQLLEIEIMDHVIIGAQRYFSLREAGLGFKQA